MAVHTVKFTGTPFSGIHVEGKKLYCRSSAAGDAGTINIYGRATSGSTAAYEQLNPPSSGGKIEQLSAATWDNLYLAKWDSALAGVGSVFSNDGTEAVGTITILSQPADGDTLVIGLTGFTKSFAWETGTIDTNGHVKSVASATTCAANLASAINDASTGSPTGSEGTGWTNTDGANPYLTATASGATVTVTDRIKCIRSLTWVTTTSDASKVAISAIRGGIDGTKIVDIPAASTTASTSASSGIDLDSEDLATTNASGLLTGASDSVATRGRFVVDIHCTDPAASVASKVQMSNDNTNWRDATSTIADLNTTQTQKITGNDLFAPYARINFTTWSVTAAKAYNIKIITQD